MTPLIRSTATKSSHNNSLTNIHKLDKKKFKNIWEPLARIVTQLLFNEVAYEYRQDSYVTKTFHTIFKLARICLGDFLLKKKKKSKN